jgi:DNA transformation protein and related proteins
MNNEMANLGPQSRAWLAAVGVHTQADLAEIGAVEAYHRAKVAFPDRVTLNLLYGLEGALLGIRWDELPAEIKADLQRQLEEKA